MEDYESEDIPETQPIEDEQNDSQLEVEPSQPSPPSCWGRLYPLSRSLGKCDLVQTEVTFGSENCTFILPKLLLEKRYVVSVCKKHFEIKRTTEIFRGRRSTVVRLYDHSESGLYVIESGKVSQRPATVKGRVTYRKLNNNDIISLPTSNFNGERGFFHAFVYIDCFAAQLNYIPQVVHRKYQVSFRLGCGTFGEVYLAFNKSTGESSAMKTIVQNTLTDRREDHNRMKLAKEIEILKLLQHTHIIKCIDALDCGKDTFLFMEYMTGGDLSDRIRQAGHLSEDLAKLFFYQICQGVKYLHEKSVIHRDIKPANVLMATNSKVTIVKLTDFGLSKVLSSTVHMKTACGTKMYAAPELLSGKENRKYTSKVDIWSLGVLLYVSLSGKDPFVEQPHLMENHIRNGIYVMETQQWRHISTLAKNLIDDMMMTNPDKRINIDGVASNIWLKDEGMHKNLRSLYDSYGCLSDLNFNIHCKSPPLKKCKVERNV